MRHGERGAVSQCDSGRVLVRHERDRARDRAEEAARLGASPLTLALAWTCVGDADRAFSCLEQESFQVYCAPHAVSWDEARRSRDNARLAGVLEQRESGDRNGCDRH